MEPRKDLLLHLLGAKQTQYGGLSFNIFTIFPFVHKTISYAIFNSSLSLPLLSYIFLNNSKTYDIFVRFLFRFISFLSLAFIQRLTPVSNTLTPTLFLSSCLLFILSLSHSLYYHSLYFYVYRLSLSYSFSYFISLTCTHPFISLFRRFITLCL